MPLALANHTRSESTIQSEQRGHGSLLTRLAARLALFDHSGTLTHLAGHIGLYVLSDHSHLVSCGCYSTGLILWIIWFHQ